MNPGEYEIMAQVEGQHWWYRGLRDVYLQSLRHLTPKVPSQPKILDAGCGTGGNLSCLLKTFQPSYIAGFDFSEEALQFAREKVPQADIYRGDICDPLLPQDGFDLIVSLDVIYIPGLQRALPGLQRLVTSLRPGGLFILNLPSYNWLYSEHDVAIHTSQRFTKRQVHTLLGQLGLSIERLSYRLFFLFPAVVVSRLPSMLRARSGNVAVHSELHSRPQTLTNKAFFSSLVFENQLISRGFCFPWGSSVFAIGRKR